MGITWDRQTALVWLVGLWWYKYRKNTIFLAPGGNFANEKADINRNFIGHPLSVPRLIYHLTVEEISD